MRIGPNVRAVCGRIVTLDAAGLRRRAIGAILWIASHQQTTSRSRIRFHCGALNVQVMEIPGRGGLVGRELRANRKNSAKQYKLASCVKKWNLLADLKSLLGRGVYDFGTVRVVLPSTGMEPAVHFV